MLPDIGGHRHNARESTSLPPEGLQQDPFMQGHSKLYHRRREIEAELRREFNLPEEGVARDALPGRGDGPIMFGRPPPVPRPRRSQHQMPRAQVQSEPPSRRRWGNIEEPALKSPEKEHSISPSRHRSDKNHLSDKEEQWWRKEQQEMRERRASAHLEQLVPGAAAWPAQDSPSPPPPVPPPAAAPPKPVDRTPTVERMQPELLGRDRPRKWRNMDAGALEAQAAAQLGPAGRLPPASNSHPAAGSNAPPPPPPMPSATPHTERVQQKARDLEDLSKEFRAKREAREERRRLADSAEKEAPSPEQKPDAAEADRELRRRLSEEKAQEARRREEQRFAELRAQELRNRQQEVDEAEHRRRDQEDWENEIRKQFKDEEKQRKQQFQREMAEDQEKNAQVRAQAEQFERQGHSQARTLRKAEAEREVKRRAEAERWRRQMEQEADRIREAEMERVHAAEAEKFRAAEAERLKFIKGWNPAPPRPGRSSSRTEVPSGCSMPSAPARERSSRAAPPAPPAPPSHDRRSFSVPAAPAANGRVPAAEVLRQAEYAAMQQLHNLERLPTREEKHKGFKELLRAWHPDKNPQNVEVATAVFQRLNAERKKVLS